MCMCVGAYLKGQQAESCTGGEDWASCVQARDSCTLRLANVLRQKQMECGPEAVRDCSKSALGQAAPATSVPGAEASFSGQNMSPTSFCQ